VVKATGAVFSGTVPLPISAQSRPTNSGEATFADHGSSFRSIGESSYSHLPDYRDGWYDAIQDTSQGSDYDSYR